MLSSFTVKLLIVVARLVAILIVLCFASYKSVAQCPGGLALSPSSANIAGLAAARFIYGNWVNLPRVDR